MLWVVGREREQKRKNPREIRCFCQTSPARACQIGFILWSCAAPLPFTLRINISLRYRPLAAMMDLQAPSLTFLPSFFLSSSPTSTSPFAVPLLSPFFALLPVSLSRRAECLPSSSSARVHEVGAIEEPSDQLNNRRSLFFFFLLFYRKFFCHYIILPTVLPAFNMHGTERCGVH